MPAIRNNSVGENSEGDLIIDLMSDLIVQDVIKDHNISVSAEEAIDMRHRFSKVDKIADAWYELVDAKEKGKK